MRTRKRRQTQLRRQRKGDVYKRQDLGHAVREAGSLVKHVHLADNDRYYPGHGHMNFREILQGLKDIGYDGAMALETFCKPESRVCARKSLAFLDFVMEEVYGNVQK